MVSLEECHVCSFLQLNLRRKIIVYIEPTEPKIKLPDKHRSSSVALLTGNILSLHGIASACTVTGRCTRVLSARLFFTRACLSRFDLDHHLRPTVPSESCICSGNTARCLPPLLVSLELVLFHRQSLRPKAVSVSTRNHAHTVHLAQIASRYRPRSYREDEGYGERRDSSAQRGSASIAERTVPGRDIHRSDGADQDPRCTCRL